MPSFKNYTIKLCLSFKRSLHIGEWECLEDFLYHYKVGWGTVPNKSSTNAGVQHGTFKSRTLRPWCWEGLKRREKGTREDEMVGWHHRFHGHEFEQVLGAGDGQGSLAGRSPWGCKESDTTEWLNWTELKGRENLSKKKGRGQHNCYRLSMFPVKAHLCLIEGKSLLQASSIKNMPQPPASLAKVKLTLLWVQNLMPTKTKQNATALRERVT